MDPRPEDNGVYSCEAENEAKLRVSTKNYVLKMPDGGLLGYLENKWRKQVDFTDYQFLG